MAVALRRRIDWCIISCAVDRFSELGYEPIEVPWLVPSEVTHITLPRGFRAISTPEGDLVGSGEQGLLALAVEGRLAPGSWQTTTPCFRDDVPDDLHGRHFVKVELMVLGSEATMATRDRMVEEVRQHIGRPTLVEPSGPNQVDIVCARTGAEYGSYGLRTHGEIRWVYGTGAAEPRWSTLIRSSSGP